MRKSVVEYCSQIGKDPMLVQGAGGNVSWKEGSTLFVKASGTWLADAVLKDIFVPVDLSHLKHAISLGNFDVTPQCKEGAVLKPSIETLLHAILPHTIVLHLHAIEMLSHLVRPHFNAESLLVDSIHWATVGYHKPGRMLARAVFEAVLKASQVNVVFLQNHGVVIGGETIAEVENILHELLTFFCVPPRHVFSCKVPQEPIYMQTGELYFPVSDPKLHQLAINRHLFNRLDSQWALYPDHIVFLGAKAQRFNHLLLFQKTTFVKELSSDVVFIRDFGVFSKEELDEVKLAQLLCYYEVICRQPEHCVARELTKIEIAELLNWNAEKHRIEVSKIRS